LSSLAGRSQCSGIRGLHSSGWRDRWASFAAAATAASFSIIDLQRLDAVGDRLDISTGHGLLLLLRLLAVSRLLWRALSLSGLLLVSGLLWGGLLLLGLLLVVLILVLMRLLLLRFLLMLLLLLLRLLLLRLRLLTLLTLLNLLLLWLFPLLLVEGNVFLLTAAAAPTACHIVEREELQVVFVVDFVVFRRLRPQVELRRPRVLCQICDPVIGMMTLAFRITSVLPSGGRVRRDVSRRPRPREDVA